MIDQSTAGAPGAGLSVTEAAAALRLSKITVRRRVSSGAWPGGRSGSRWLVSRPFIDALVSAITTGARVDAEAFAAAWMSPPAEPTPDTQKAEATTSLVTPAHISASAA